MPPITEHDQTLWQILDPTSVDPDMSPPLTTVQARDWHLVLTSCGIDTRLQQVEDGWHLAVPAPDLQRALYALRLYTEENRHWPPSPPTATSLDNAWVSACVLAALALFHNITRLHYPSLDIKFLPWLASGNAHVASIRSGQWWRLATALTLHSDALHLAGNILIGGVFIIRLCREVGSGTGWCLLLLAGVSGNYLNCLIQAPSHQSVGASTAVFGAIGILAALNARRHRLRLTKRWTLPLAASLALLALLGTGGEHTDLLAHLFGFLCGLAAGWLLAPLPRPGPLLNRWLGIFAASFIVLAWWLALRK
ncbi:MAG: rhomboid family intramembrane serine protease [Pedobacter sp.]